MSEGGNALEEAEQAEHAAKAPDVGSKERIQNHSRTDAPVFVGVVQSVRSLTEQCPGAGRTSCE